MWTLLTLLLLFIFFQIWASAAGSASTELETKPTATEETAEPARPAVPLHPYPSTIRYLASCPCCGERLTRRDYFTWQVQIRRRCRKCHTALKSNFSLDTIWCLISASPFAVCFFLALFSGSVSWLAVVGAALLHFIAGYVLFPYNTKIEIADEIPQSQWPLK